MSIIDLHLSQRSQPPCHRNQENSNQPRYRQNPTLIETELIVMIYNESVCMESVCEGVMMFIIIASIVTLLFIWSDSHIEHFEQNNLNVTHNLTHLTH